MEKKKLNEALKDFSAVLYFTHADLTSSYIEKRFNALEKRFDSLIEVVKVFCEIVLEKNIGDLEKYNKYNRD